MIKLEKEKLEKEKREKQRQELERIKVKREERERENGLFDLDDFDSIQSKPVNKPKVDNYKHGNPSSGAGIGNRQPASSSSAGPGGVARKDSGNGMNRNPVTAGRGAGPVGGGLPKRNVGP